MYDGICEKVEAEQAVNVGLRRRFEREWKARRGYAVQAQRTELQLRDDRLRLNEWAGGRLRRVPVARQPEPLGDGGVQADVRAA